MRYLAATELLYVMYIGSVARNRMSKKLERLLSVMLLPIIPKVPHYFISVMLLPIIPKVPHYFKIRCMTALNLIHRGTEKLIETCSYNKSIP